MGALVCIPSTMFVATSLVVLALAASRAAAKMQGMCLSGDEQMKLCLSGTDLEDKYPAAMAKCNLDNTAEALAVSCPKKLPKVIQAIKAFSNAGDCFMKELGIADGVPFNGAFLGSYQGNITSSFSDKVKKYKKQVAACVKKTVKQFNNVQTSIKKCKYRSKKAKVAVKKARDNFKKVAPSLCVITMMENICQMQGKEAMDSLMNTLMTNVADVKITNEELKHLLGNIHAFSFDKSRMQEPEEKEMED